MNIKTLKEFAAEISYIKINLNGFVIVDIENRVYVFDKDFKLKNGFKIKLPQNKPSENTIDVDEGFNYLLLSVPNKPLTLWDIKNKKLINKYEWHRGDVLSVVFGENYFASGGVDGKIFLYSLALREMVSKMARHKDFITDLTFGEDEIYACGYDKSVLFVDLYSLKKTVRFLHLKKTVKIENKGFLTSASEYSDIIKWNAETKDVKDKLNLYEKFNDFFIYEKYLFIAVEGRIVLYDLENEVFVNERFLNVEASKIAVYGDRLYIVRENVLECMKLNDENEILDMILKGDYKKAYEAVLLNPFLKKTQSYAKLEILYKKSLLKAVKYFENGLKSKAVELLKPFMGVLEKREEISKLIAGYEHFLKFKKAFENRNFALFYHLASQYKILRKTKYFQIAEKEWELKFEEAKKAVLDGNVSLAEEILRDFLPVSEKRPLINILLKKAGLLQMLKEKLAKKDFGGFFALVKEHPELRDTKEYKNVMHFAEKLYGAALRALEEERFKYVLKISEILENIEGYEVKAKELQYQALISLDFLKIFQDDKNKAFEMVEKYPFLKKLKAYRIYEERWRKKLEEAEKSAFQGKIKSALEELKEYEYVYAKRPRIKNMIKSAYLNHIKNTGNKELIKKYLKVFGKDDEIAKLASSVS
ncbi:hypothetical protein [Nautilia sp.]